LPHSSIPITELPFALLGQIWLNFSDLFQQAQVPGLEWIETFHGGAVSNFVNGYMPVVALLGLILILPVIFEYVASNYEHRKTFSDIQASMLGRYFYYQLVYVLSFQFIVLLRMLFADITHPFSFSLLYTKAMCTFLSQRVPC